MNYMTTLAVLAAWLLIGAACARHHAPDATRAGTPSAPPHIASQKSSAELALTLRRQADDLRENALHHEREAALLADRGADAAFVRENRELAERLWHEADEKEQEARAMSRQVPHNMVQ